MGVHGSTASQLRVNHFLAKLQLLTAHLRLFCPVIAELGQIITGIIEVEHGGGIGGEHDRFLLLMLYLAPRLDDVLFGIGHIMQCHIYRILVIAQVYHGFRTTFYRLGRGRNVIKNRRRIAVIMSDGDGRFKVIFIAGTAIHFPAALAHAAVRPGMYIPTEVLQILLVQEFLAQVRLIQAAVFAYLEHQIGVVRRDADGFFFRCMGIRQGCECKESYKQIFHGVR